MYFRRIVLCPYYSPPVIEIFLHILLDELEETLAMPFSDLFLLTICDLSHLREVDFVTVRPVIKSRRSS